MRDLDPVLITRTDIQNMLGGISRTTFYRMRQRWKREGTPFPEPVNDIMPPKGGTLYRHKEVNCGKLQNRQSDRHSFK
ncbi:hypothetical protein CITFRE_40760 [Citrobacter freundii]|nr:hypothetical protein CITFRE_40760 [Citrobacter freundii]